MARIVAAVGSSAENARTAVGAASTEEVEDLRQEMALLASSVSVFVATAGDDDSGDGTLNNPYATIARALRDRQGLSDTGIAFRVQVVPPYSGPGFLFEEVNPVIAVSTVSSAAKSGSISVESYYDPALIGVNDPRFTNEVGPITSTAASIYAVVFPSYTVPAGSFTDAHIGKVIRVFRSGVEVGRGTLATIVTGASDVIYLTQSRLSEPVTTWNPTAGDVLYACDYRVVITSPVSISCGRRNHFLLTGLKIQASGLPFVANMLTIYGGIVRTAGIRLVATDYTYGLEVRSGGTVMSQYNGSTSAPWMNSTERNFSFMSGGFISHASLQTNYATYITGTASLAGFVLDKKTYVTDLGHLYLTGTWFRGQLLVGSGARIDQGGDATVVFGGDRTSPYVQPPMWFDSARIGITGGGGQLIIVDVAGYGAGLPMVSVRRTVFSSKFIIDGFAGAASITSPVMVVEEFSTGAISEGTITGPAGQDVRAGTTYGAFADLPIVDAPTLTRIATS